MHIVRIVVCVVLAGLMASGVVWAGPDRAYLQQLNGQLIRPEGFVGPFGVCEVPIKPMVRLHDLEDWWISFNAYGPDPACDPPDKERLGPIGPIPSVPRVTPTPVCLEPPCPQGISWYEFRVDEVMS